jgi:hypothetical protein
MPATRIVNFGGVIPRQANRRLPGESAREASNVNLLPGELRPLRKSRLRWTPTAAASLLSFYRVDDSTWFGWPTTGVDMQVTALEGTARYAYTGDGIPKLTTKALGTPVTPGGSPAAARAMGIPAPTAAVGVSHSGGSGATSTRFYVCTFYSDWNEESAPSPVSASIVGKVDGTWAITGLPATPPNTGSVTAATHSAGTVTITIGPHFNRAGDAVSITGVVGMTDLNGTWTIASVPSSTQIAITLTTAQTYTSGGTWARVNAWGTCNKRLYRTAGNIADFQLVADGITGTTYNDTLTDAQILGDSLLSNGWLPPPVDLVGLVALPGGVLAGFRLGGKSVCFCEPYQPHAWPTRFQIKVSDEVVGIAAFDSNVGVATKGAPVVLTGVEPGQMSPIRFPQPLPCLSRFSVCSVANGILYSSKNGLVRLDLSGAQVFTANLFTPEGWNALSPSTMRCAYDGSRILVSTTANKQCYVLDASGSGGQLITVSQPMDHLQGDPSTGDLYFAFGRSVYRFDSFDTAPLTMDWWSQEYVIPKPSNMGVAKVETDPAYTAEATAALAAEREELRVANAAAMSSPMGGRGAFAARAININDINASTLAPLPDATVAVSFTLYVGNTIVYSGIVPDDKPFRLPGGYLTDAFSVRVQGNTQIRALVIADTPSSLAKA